MTEIGTALPTERQGRALQILVVDDESVIRGPLAVCLETLGHQVLEASAVEEAITHANRVSLDVALVDLRLGSASGLDLMTQLLALHPRLKIIIITAYGSVDVAVRAMARGAADFLCKPFTPDQLAAAVARAAALRDLESDVGIASDSRGTAGPEADFATTDAALQEAILTARRIAPTSTPILISGAPGVGKTVLARAIHGWGRRPEGPFISIDCASRSAAYIDLALFGDAVVGGQSIKASDVPLLLKATGGTLLVKHVELLATSSQERLAHAIESRSLETRDAAKPAVCDCRIITTTLQTDMAVEQGPLSALLGRFHISVPPLGQRPRDIPMLAQRYIAFARQNGAKQVLGLSADAIEHLIAYSWPGNLRELHAVINEAFQEAESPYIESRHLRSSILNAHVRRRPQAGDRITLHELEAAHIREILALKKSLQESADILGLDPQALYRRRKQFGIE